jgi:hypothetical protein
VSEDGDEQSTTVREVRLDAVFGGLVMIPLGDLGLVVIVFPSWR